MLRFAIYFTPRADSELAKAAVAWLGRDTDNSSFLGQPTLTCIGEKRLREITAAPFHYGFHGTIKPPFQLAPNVTIEEVVERLEVLAASQKKFILPPLELTEMHDFFCLRPKAYCQQLYDLASETIRYFDDFRLPAVSEELKKRRGAGLSSRQELMLTTWGYPYVMEEFRFHLTLTGRISGRGEKQIIGQELQQRFLPEISRAVVFDSLSLFVEIDRAPMIIVQSFPLQ